MLSSLAIRRPGSRWSEILASRLALLVSTTIAVAGFLLAGAAPAVAGSTSTSVPPGQIDGWTQVVKGGFTDPNNSSAPFSAEFKGYLYVSTIANPAGFIFSGSHKEGGDIWRSSDGITWEQVGTPGLGNAHNSTFRFVVFRDKLYAVSDNLSDHGLEIWVTSNGTDFTQIEKGGFGGDADSSSSEPFVFQDRLIIPVANTSTGAQIWVSDDGENFRQVVSGGMGDKNNTGLQVTTQPDDQPLTFQGKLYVGVTNQVAGGEIWRTSDGLQWERAASGGLERSANVGLYPEVVFHDQLYAVGEAVRSLDDVQGLEVYRSSDGTAWQKVVSNGFDVGTERNVAGSLAQFKGDLFLTCNTLEPRILTPPSPSERIPPQGFQLYKSADGAQWTQVGEDGLGADSTIGAAMNVLDGTAYLSAYDYRQGGQLWQSADGVDWKLVFREPVPSMLTEGGGIVAFQGHLLWVDNDLKRGVEIWRTDQAWVVEETTTSLAGGATGTTGSAVSTSTVSSGAGSTAVQAGTGATGEAAASTSGGLSGGWLALIVALAVIAVAAVVVAALLLRRRPAPVGGGTADGTAATRQGPGRSFFCSNCGSPINEGAKYCPSCGQAIS
jgi:hypothetical protein